MAVPPTVIAVVVVVAVRLLDGFPLLEQADDDSGFDGVPGEPEEEEESRPPPLFNGEPTGFPHPAGEPSEISEFFLIIPSVNVVLATFRRYRFIHFTAYEQASLLLSYFLKLAFFSFLSSF